MIERYSVPVLNPWLNEIKIMRFILLATSAFCLLSQTVSAETYTAEVWADNWFQFNVDGMKVAEDSVSIDTERSFNAERFSFESKLLFTVGLIAKDFRMQTYSL